MLHIVDDEEVIRDALSWLAQSRGIAAPPTTAPSLPRRWKAGRLRPGGDCVLLDVRMPAMNGVALFDLLDARGLTARLPVIFLTGHGDVPMAVDALKRGAFDFFEKPFNDNS
jgi:two-component system response regulator DctR